MAADELGGRVHHDVGAVLDGSAQVGRGERGVDHERQPVGMRHVGQRRNVGDGARRVPDDLRVDQLGPGRDRRRVIVDVVGGHERRGDPQTPQGHVELGVGASVQRRRGHDVVARVAQGREGEELGGEAARGGDGADPPVERRHPLLERGRGGIGDPGVDAAVLLEGEQVGGIGGVLEHEARGLVDGHGPGARRGVGTIAGVHGSGPKTWLAVGGGHGWGTGARVEAMAGRSISAPQISMLATTCSSDGVSGDPSAACGFLS